MARVTPMSTPSLPVAWSPATRIVPPVWGLLAGLAMIALDQTLPTPWRLDPLWARGGLGLIVLGVCVQVLAAWQFRRHRTAFCPGIEATTLVTTGIFAYSRNPMYVGSVLILAGIAWFLGSPTPWLVLPVFIWLIATAFVAREEQALSAQFGEAYRAYCARVRRWI